MKRAWPLLAAGAVAYLLVLIVTFPAARVVPLLQRQVAGLSLHAVSGSVFSGQAAQLVYEGLDFGHLTWRVRPAMLLLGRMEFRIELTDPANPGHANIAVTPWGSVYGRDIRIMLSPDRMVNRYSPVPVTTSGSMQLELETLNFAGDFPEDITGVLRWDDGVVLDPVEIVLGDVSMAITSQDNTIVGSIVQGGRQEAAGEVQLFADGRYEINLRILPDTEMNDDTLSALETVGQMQSDSTLLFRSSGQL